MCVCDGHKWKTGRPQEVEIKTVVAFKISSVGEKKTEEHQAGMKAKSEEEVKLREDAKDAKDAKLRRASALK